MEIKEMQMSDIEERLTQLSEDLKNPEANLDELQTEVEALEARKAELIQIAEQRKAELEAALNDTHSQVINDFNNLEGRTMGAVEVRSTNEYAQAFLGMLKTGKDEEVRSLLSENGSGVVPIPTFLEDEIKNAWEDCKIMSLVKQTTYKGNVKIGFEVSATGASVHVEGSEAPEEETLVWGTVELKAENIKKWITVSDEALEGTTVDTMGELYKEIAQRIVEKAEEIAIGKIASAPTTTDATHCGVPQYKASAIAEDTIVMAEALLSGKAKNLNIAMNRQTYAAFTSVALKAKYAVDVFDGLKDKVVFTDALPAFSAAEADAVYVIIGDFNYGFQANKPNGNDITLKVDDLSLAEKDLVKIVGKQYVGMGVVAPKAFVNITK